MTKLWLVKIGEPWPTDNPAPRLNRTGVMAQLYANHGDEVTWINDVFDHNAKAQRFNERVSITPQARLQIIGLRGPGYPRNVSLRRFIHHGRIAAEFKKISSQLPRPDLILTSVIPLELMVEAVRFGRSNDIPVIVDVRDMWPDAWLDVIPIGLRGIARSLFRRYYRMLEEGLRGASAICALSSEALDWALVHSKRAKRSLDSVLPLAYLPPEISPAQRSAAAAFWDGLGVNEKSEGRLRICFIGTFTKRVEFSTIIEAAKLLDVKTRERIQFVFCGSGELDYQLRQATKALDCFLFPGWVEAAKLAVLLERVQIGILPYPSDSDFRRSIPNKVFDYLNGGLPILTCLRGAVEALVTQSGSGWMYENGSPASLCDVIHRLMEDPSSISAASQNAHRVANEFDATTLYLEYRNRLGIFLGEYSSAR